MAKTARKTASTKPSAAKVISAKRRAASAGHGQMSGTLDQSWRPNRRPLKLAQGWAARGAEGIGKLINDAATKQFLADAFAHLKVIGFTSAAEPMLTKAGIERMLEFSL